MAEVNTPRPVDAAGEYSLYDENMTLVYLADAQTEERTALHLVLVDLLMEVEGEASDLVHHIGQSPHNRPGYAVGGLGLAAH